MLVVCPECNRRVSESTESCPNCGYPGPFGRGFFREVSLTRDQRYLLKMGSMMFGPAGMREHLEECGVKLSRLEQLLSSLGCDDIKLSMISGSDEIPDGLYAWSESTGAVFVLDT